MGGGGGGGGFFDNPVQNIGTGVGYAIGGPAGAFQGGLAGNIMGSGQKAAPPPGMDPQLAALRDRRTKEANDFRENIPGLQQDMGRDLTTQSARGLEQDINTDKASFNRRGLLGSGLNQAADAGASGKAAVGLANSKQQLNNQLQDQADQMQNAAITSGYQYWQSAKAIQDSSYNAALSNMMAARSGTTALLGAGFKGAGAALGA